MRMSIKKGKFSNSIKMTHSQSKLITKIKSQALKPSKENSCKTILKTFEHFCDKTNLHGLGFVGDPTITYGERAFWLFAFIVGLIFATYFINNIYDKYNTSPVIISWNPEPVNIAAIPFPAITICNLNQATKEEAGRIFKTGSAAEQKALVDFCDLNVTNENYIEETEEIASNWKKMREFIIRLNQPCEEMLKVCRWKHITYNCSEIFKLFFTDDGMCCAFNRIPKHFIYTDNIENEKIEEIYHAVDWNPMHGFPPNTPENSTPWRPTGAGVNFALTVVADINTDNYFCSSGSSLGLKILISNPVETPKMADFGLIISPGTENRIAISPEMSDATSTLLNIDVKKRNCFFPYERKLKFFRIYTERNCRLECQANYTYESCDCVPYYLPRNSNISICSKKQEKCSADAKVTMETLRLNGTSCNCLDGCFELSYKSSITTGKLSDKFQVKKRIIEDTNPQYFADNMAVMHFFFIDNKFRKQTKSELFGFTEFLSNTGGLLGLFLGFSFLSFVEIGYYLSLRAMCRSMKNRKINQTNNMDKAVVYPYMN